MKLPDGVRAVITGSGSGLGRELALQLARRKARLLIADVHAVRAAETVELVKAAGGGLVGAAFALLPEMAAYNTGKAAVVALTETLAAELGASRVAVTALCPAFFKTNLMESFRSPSDRQRNLAEGMFNASTMTVERVAQIALRDLERGTLICLPQYDASFVWQVKRLFPWLYHRVVRWGHQRDVVSKRFGADEPK